MCHTKFRRRPDPHVMFRSIPLSAQWSAFPHFLLRLQDAEIPERSTLFDPRESSWPKFKDVDSPWPNVADIKIAQSKPILPHPQKRILRITTAMRRNLYDGIFWQLGCAQCVFTSSCTCWTYCLFPGQFEQNLWRAWGDLGTELCDDNLIRLYGDSRHRENR